MLTLLRVPFYVEAMRHWRTPDQPLRSTFCHVTDMSHHDGSLSGVIARVISVPGSSAACAVKRRARRSSKFSGGIVSSRAGLHRVRAEWATVATKEARAAALKVKQKSACILRLSEGAICPDRERMGAANEACPQGL